MLQTALSRLSWVPLGLAALLGGVASPACISEPLPLENTQQIPPFIIVEKTEPPPWVFKRITSDESQDLKFHVPFFSEDVNSPVQALVYVDVLPGDSGQRAGARTGLATDQNPPNDIEEASPGTFGVERSIQFELATLTRGCHAVSALLTHASNFDNATILNKDLVARVTWWFEVQGTLPVEVADCPILGVEPLPSE